MPKFADTTLMSVAEIDALARAVLTHHGLSKAQAASMSRVIAAAERDACPAHGLYRLPATVRTIRAGLVNLNGEPAIERRGGGIVVADARHTLAPFAFERAQATLVATAREQGIALLAIRNCFHLTALWPEVEPLAVEGLAALAMTPSQSFVAPAGGRAPLLGTNPIAFGWPRPGPHPFVFDFATSAAARGEIDLLRRAGHKAPDGWGLAPDGTPTNDPTAILAGAMTTFGGHKGSALSIMVELLAGALIGDLTSKEARAVDGGAELAPLHGELVIAIDPAHFAASDGVTFTDRAEALFADILGQGARLPSGRRYIAREHSLAHGVEVKKQLVTDVEALLLQAVSMGESIES